MNFTDLLLEALHAGKNIDDISNQITHYIDEFKESGSIKRIIDITDYFNIEGSSINLIKLELLKNNIEFADINVDPRKKTLRIRLGITKKKDNYSSSIRHEVIHAFDYIKSNGKSTKYGYKTNKEYYSHEFEFNEKINEIAQKLGKIKYTNKKNLLGAIWNITSPDFYGVLSTDDKLYQRLLHRLIREKVLEA
jgi:ABC-type amino acid transport substrate-binding protein